MGVNKKLHELKLQRLSSKEKEPVSFPRCWMLDIGLPEEVSQSTGPENVKDNPGKDDTSKET